MSTIIASPAIALLPITGDPSVSTSTDASHDPRFSELGQDGTRFRLDRALTSDVDGEGRVFEPITDGVGDDRIGDHPGPVVQRKLRRIPPPCRSIVLQGSRTDPVLRWKRVSGREVEVFEAWTQGEALP